LSSLNVVYADANDTIGWQLIGETPRRKQGRGVLPLSGALTDGDWHAEPVAFDEMPRMLNPDTHFVATANNQPFADGAGPYLGIDWADGYRQARIVEVLRTRWDWTAADMQTLQMDRLSIPWREMRERVLAALRPRSETREALMWLEAWDGVMSPDSSAATLFKFFLTAIARRVATVIAPNSARWAMGAGFNPHVSRSSIGARRISHLVELLRDQPEGVLPQSWDREIVDAMLEALRVLRAKHGARVEDWGWGRVRPLMLGHAFGARRLLGRIFNLGPIGYGGDGQTVAQAGVVLDDPAANATTIANLRMVVDVGNWEESRFVLAGGQSGNPLSPHYDDQLPLWERGAGIAIAWRDEAIERATKSKLQLLPEE
jgi:penicillin amidase